MCRICLEKIPAEYLQKDKLVFKDATICEPCNCIGSIKYIHKECLKVIIIIYVIFILLSFVAMDKVKKMLAV